jgi:two-component system NarL family response regulator
MKPNGADDESTVMIVDGHRIFRDGVRDFLAEQGIVVAGEAGDAADAVALAADCHPDVALMDLDLPGASGIDATRRIRLVSPVTRILVLTVSAREHDVYEALRAGACGYLLKDSPAEEIVAGIRAAAAGHSLLSPQVAAFLLERLRGSFPAADLPDHVAPQLTKRELEVLSLIAAGKENGEIADSLVISQHTAKNHVSSILAKLEVENRIQAAVYAVRQRLV